MMNEFKCNGTCGCEGNCGDACKCESLREEGTHKILHGMVDDDTFETCDYDDEGFDSDNDCYDGDDEFDTVINTNPNTVDCCYVDTDDCNECIRDDDDSYNELSKGIKVETVSDEERIKFNEAVTSFFEKHILPVLNEDDCYEEYESYDSYSPYFDSDNDCYDDDDECYDDESYESCYNPYLDDDNEDDYDEDDYYDDEDEEIQYKPCAPYFYDKDDDNTDRFVAYKTTNGSCNELVFSEDDIAIMKDNIKTITKNIQTIENIGLRLYDRNIEFEFGMFIDIINKLNNYISDICGEDFFAIIDTNGIIQESDVFSYKIKARELFTNILLVNRALISFIQ